MKTKGGSTLFNLILVLLIGYGIYVAYVYVKIELDKKLLVSAITDTLAGRGDLPTYELRKRLLNLLDRKNVDVDEESVYVNKTRDNIHLEFTYYVDRNMLLWHLEKEIFLSLDLPAVAGL